MVQSVSCCPQGGPILGMGVDEHGSGNGDGSRPVRMGGGNYNVEPLPEPEESPGCWSRLTNWLRSFFSSVRDFFSCRSCCDSSDSTSLQGLEDVVYADVKFTPKGGVNRPPTPEPEEGDSEYSAIGVGGASGTGGDPKPPQEEEEEDIFGEVGHWPPPGSDNPAGPSDGVYENWGGHRPGGSKPGSSKPVEEPIYGNVGGGAPQPQPPKPKPRTVQSPGGPKHYSGPKNGDEYAVVNRTKL